MNANEAERLRRATGRETRSDAEDRADWDAFRELGRLLDSDAARRAPLDAEALARSVVHRSSKPRSARGFSAHVWFTAATVLLAIGAAAWIWHAALQPVPQAKVEKVGRTTELEITLAWDDDWEEWAAEVEMEFAC